MAVWCTWEGWRGREGKGRDVGEFWRHVGVVVWCTDEDEDERDENDPENSLLGLKFYNTCYYLGFLFCDVVSSLFLLRLKLYFHLNLYPYNHLTSYIIFSHNALL